MNMLLQDLRYAARQLVKRPGFTAVAVLTLALGIGASTAIFSVFDAVLLSPPPYAAPERLVNLWRTGPGEDDGVSTVSYASYQARVEESDAFTSLGAYTINFSNITGGRQPERAYALAVTSSLLSTLGIEPQLGRNFTSEADRPGGPRTVLISHGLWQSSFGGDPAVVGRTVQINGGPHQIVGVLPEGFRFPPPLRLGETSLTQQADIWVPIGTVSEVFQNPRVARFFVVGRRASGVSLAEARAEMDALGAGLADTAGEDAAASNSQSIRIISLTEEVLAPVRPALLALMGAVGLLLLIACVNLAGMLLARLTRRDREIALRSALGADRGRILRQLLSESVVLAVLGGGLGALLAWAGLETLVAIAPADIPRLAQATVDGRVLAVTLALSVVTGLGFGLLPALRASRTDLKNTLATGGAGGGTGRSTRRAHGTLVAVQIALAVALLVGAGLLIRSFAELTDVDPGFKMENLLTFDLLLTGARYPDRSARVRFYDELQSRLAALPAVRSASAIDRLPFAGKDSWMSFYRADSPMPPNESPPSALNPVVLPGYFETMGIPLLRGRAFSERDGADAPPVIIISRTIAERFWPQGDAAGGRIHIFGQDRTIVGVVGNVRQYGPAAAPVHIVYFPHRQFAFGRPWMTMVLRTEVDPGRVVAAVRREVARMDSRLPISNLRTFNALAATHTAGERFNALLTGIFAALALALAALGIYGVMSFAVARRSREIGVRMALGASGGTVRRTILRRALTMVAAGTAAGLLAALALARLVRGLLFGVGPADPLTFAAVGGLLALTGLVAAWVPARRATRVNPMIALRRE